VQAEIGQKHMPLDDIDPTTLKTVRDTAAKLIARTRPRLRRDLRAAARRDA
jgi:hypothetical protein